MSTEHERPSGASLAGGAAAAGGGMPGPVHVSGATPAPRPISSPHLGPSRTEIMDPLPRDSNGNISSPDLLRQSGPPVPRPAAGAPVSGPVPIGAAAQAAPAVPGTPVSPEGAPAPDAAPRPAAPDPYVGTTFDGRYKIEKDETIMIEMDDG